ncbi:MAG: hypothetical protein ACXWV4_06870 [Flavitalea sp.]
MKSRETILDELKQISPLLAGIDPVNPYSVPYLYFEELEGKVKKAISAQDEQTGALSTNDELPGILTDLKASKPMTVPAGYFDSFASSVLQKIKEEESVKKGKAEMLSPEPLFELKSVPQNQEPVFEQSRLSRVPDTEKDSAPVIKMVPRRKVYLQWAAAAVTVGIIALAVFLYTGNKQPGNNLATTNAEIEGFSMETLESFVDGQTLNLIPTVASTSSDLKAEDMRVVMEDISEEALQLYLNTQTGNLETQVN